MRLDRSTQKSASPRVYVDFDDVLCETARVLMRVAEHEFGRRVAFESIHSFDIGTSFDLDRDQVRHVMDILHRSDIIAGLPPTPGAGPALRNWTARGCSICVVTGRPPTTADACREWLRRHDIPFAELIFVDKYGRFLPLDAHPGYLTLEELKEQDFTLAIDDSVETIRFLAAHTRIPLVLYDRPWNSRWSEHEHFSRPIRRCRGWDTMPLEDVFQSTKGEPSWNPVPHNP
jgi:hypothetical protein